MQLLVSNFLFLPKTVEGPFVGGTLMKDTCDRREEELKQIRADAVKASKVGYTYTAQDGAAYHLPYR